MTIVSIFISLLTLLLGLVLGGLFVRVRTAGATNAVVAERAQLNAAYVALTSERDNLSARFTEAQDQLSEVRDERARLQAQLEHAVADGEEKLALLRQEQQQSQEIVERLAGQAMQRTGNELLQRFLQLADERSKISTEQAKGELDQRRVAVESLVKPLSDQLGKVLDQVQAIEKERVGAYAELRHQVESMGRTSEQLRSETHQLVTALKKPQVRGRWGERQLRNVVETAGMLEHVDFIEQASVTTDEGRLRPDMVVKIGGGKTIVVDAKAPFSAFLEAQDARDDEARASRLAAHAGHVKDHVDTLADKQYWAQFPTCPEYVVMFLPSEAFLTAAEEQDPSLWDYACRRNIILATPANLVTMLRTVAYIWRQEAIAANAQQVLHVGRELHRRLATMGTHFGKLGKQLDNAVGAYNSTVSSLESRVLVTARRMTELQVVDTTLDEAKQIDRTTRHVQAPELVASGGDETGQTADADTAP